MEHGKRTASLSPDTGPAPVHMSAAGVQAPTHRSQRDQKPQVRTNLEVPQLRIYTEDLFLLNTFRAEGFDAYQKQSLDLKLCHHCGTVTTQLNLPGIHHMRVLLKVRIKEDNNKQRTQYQKQSYLEKKWHLGCTGSICWRSGLKLSLVPEFLQ